MSQVSTVRDYETAIAFLFDRINYERTSSIPYREAEFRLDRMRDLMTRLGDPQKRVPLVHLAGTKGKGSTAAMISAILRASGLKTGLYTSPHLESLEERFQIDAVPCSRARLVSLAVSVEKAAEAIKAESREQGGNSRGPTFFELTTAMGFLYFAEENCDFAVLETGLGGRLDSTNICLPRTSVITTISFDHMKQLGDTLGAIATEKAGIIKPGVPVISGVLEAEPAEVIERIARERGSKLLIRNRDFGVVPLGGNRYRYRDTIFGHVPFELEITLGMMGRHQAENAACAIAAVRETYRSDRAISLAAIQRGIAEAFCPARIEAVRERPLVILDAAHNRASVEALVAVLESEFTERRDRTLIFAISRDKSLASILDVLLPRFDRIVCTRFLNNPRARSPHEIADYVAERKRELASPIEIFTAETPDDAYDIALGRAHEESLICVAGSFFLAAELRSRLKAT